MSDVNADNLRAAMGLLRWSAAQVAAEAGVSEPTVNRLLGGQSVRVDTCEKIAAAIDAAGVELFNADRPGARRR